MIKWMKKANNLQIEKVQPQGVALAFVANLSLALPIIVSLIKKVCIAALSICKVLKLFSKTFKTV